MHKITIALLCVFLVLLGTFAACKKRSPYGAVIVDAQGMEHVVMTDANGVTVVDNDGNLVEVMTDSSNKKPITVPTASGTAEKNTDYQTHTITFPGIVENGDTVEDAFCSLTVPDGWVQAGANSLILSHTATEASVQISTDIGGTATGAIEKLTGQIEMLSPEGGYTRKDVNIDGVLATRTQYEINGLTVISYILVTEKGKVCRIDCTVKTDKLEVAGVDALVQTIHFK